MSRSRDDKKFSKPRTFQCIGTLAIFTFSFLCQADATTNLSAQSRLSKVFSDIFSPHPRKHPPQIHLRTYAQFVKLPHNKQVSYLAALQAAIVELEKEARARGDKNTADRLLEFLMASAYAEEHSAPPPQPQQSPPAPNSDDPGTGDQDPAGPSGQDPSDQSNSPPAPAFCINLGVLRPVQDPVTASCDPSKGASMHNFDTNEDLSSLLGDGATKCKGSQKPCSPMFGFDSEGNLFCSSTNLTSSCAQLSKGPNTRLLADVLVTCATNAGAGNAHVDCSKLIDFFNTQSKLVETLCNDTPDSKASGILRKQLESVSDDVATSEQQMGKDLRQVLHLAQTAADLVTNGPSGDQTPCQDQQPPRQPAGATTPDTSGNSGCKSEPLPSGSRLDFFGIFKTVESQNADDSCVQVTLPSQGSVKIDFRQENNPQILIQAPAVNGVAAPVIATLPDDRIVMARISSRLKDPPFSIPESKLLDAYMPIKLLSTADSGKMSPPGQSSQPYDTRGWMTEDGTRIRYISGKIFRGSDNKNYLVVGVTPLGGTETKIPVDPSPPTDTSNQQQTTQHQGS